VTARAKAIAVGNIPRVMAARKVGTRGKGAAKEAAASIEIEATMVTALLSETAV
jgi:hypothetical protein